MQNGLRFTPYIQAICGLFAVTDSIVYLMRGLPSCGKSHRAAQLAGTIGLVCETDDFFFSQVGDNPDKYDYDADRLDEARDWNFQRYTDAVNAGVSPIIVDRGNGLNLETQRYARFGVSHGYTVLLTEPDSPWWQEIRVLLQHKQHTMPVLKDWAKKLARKNRASIVLQKKRFFIGWKSGIPRYLWSRFCRSTQTNEK